MDNGKKSEKRQTFARAFKVIGKLIAKNEGGEVQERLIKALEMKGKVDLTSHFVASICRKVNAFNEGRDCLKEADQWFLRFEYIDKILEYLDQESPEYVLWQKIEMVNLLGKIECTEEIFDAIITRAKEVPIYKQGSFFFLRLCNVLRNDVMTKKDTLAEWQIFLREYLQDFGFFVDRACVLIHRQLLQGLIPLVGGINSSGPKGVEQLQKALNARAQRLFDKGDIDEADIVDPLTAIAISRFTGFSLSPWGHGALGCMKLHSFIKFFQAQKKIILGGNLIGALQENPFSLNVRETFFVRRLGKTKEEGADCIEASITKGVLGELAGDIGHTCYSKLADIMIYPRMVGAVIFTRGKEYQREFVGSSFILENTINGDLVWIICALNFQENFLGKYKLNDFVSGMITYIQNLAKHERVQLVLSPVGLPTAVSMRSRVSRVFTEFVTGSYLFLDHKENFYNHPMQDKVKAFIPRVL